MIDNQKIDFDAYLKGINKSEEEFEDEISKSADIRLKRAIIIEEIVNYYEVKIDDKLVVLSENQSTYIPLGSRHRLSNPGKIPLVLIEVQSGAYVGEDDIVRFEDKYGRDK